MSARGLKININTEGETEATPAKKKAPAKKPTAKKAPAKKKKIEQSEDMLAIAKENEEGKVKINIAGSSTTINKRKQSETKEDEDQAVEEEQEQEIQGNNEADEKESMRRSIRVAIQDSESGKVSEGDEQVKKDITKEETEEVEEAEEVEHVVSPLNRQLEQLKQKGLHQHDKEINEIRDGAKQEHKEPKSRSIKLYRKIAYSFIALTLVLLSVIFYFSFAKVTISLVPNQERISNNLIFDIYDKDYGVTSNDIAIEGIVKNVEVNLNEGYIPSGADIIGEETIGKITIINNYIKNQPLVATTRLVPTESPNMLFRVKETVNIPSGGSVEVEVYADEPSPETAISPTNFTIPGLWAGLQDKIFGKSSEAFVYQQKTKKYIIEKDIDNAVRDAKQKLLEKAKDDVHQTYSDYSEIIYTVDEDSVEWIVDGDVGDETDTFSVAITAEVIVVAFDESKSSELAQDKFISALPSSKELMSFEKDNIIYSLDAFDTDRGVASANANFEGRVSLNENTEVVDIDKIIGLNKNQVEAYLNGLPEIAGYEMKFFPSFIKKVPRLKDRIIIQVKK